MPTFLWSVGQLQVSAAQNIRLPPLLHVIFRAWLSDLLEALT